MPLNTLPMRVWAISQGCSMVATLRMISDTANMPIMIGISVSPPASSALPKVKRGNPAGLSSPTEATSRPASSETRSEEHTSELQSQSNLVCRLLLEKKKKAGPYLLVHATRVPHELVASC